MVKRVNVKCFSTIKKVFAEEKECIPEQRPDFFAQEKSL